MANDIDELDEARHQHHLRNRSDLDKLLARSFWVAICFMLLLRVVYRTFHWWSRRRRDQKHHRPRIASLRADFIDRIAALLKAFMLFSVTRRLGSFKLAFKLGQVAVAVAYLCIICLLITSVDAPKFSSHFVDDVAFRAAWMTLTQIPLVYLLATKRGPFNILANLSYERINWIHRWSGRIMFLSATTHMLIMMYSISIADIIRSPDKVMIIVRYGVGAYGTLLWIVATSILPLRQWSYRVFYINHVMVTLTFLWMLFKHVPKYARTPIYVAAGIVASDRCHTLYLFVRNNVAMRPIRRALFSKSRKILNRKHLAFGHSVKMSSPGLGRTGLLFPTSNSRRASDTTTIIRVGDVPLTWRPGQHIRLYLPRLGRFEMHPFTPATCSRVISVPTSPGKDRDVEGAQLLPPSTDSTRNDMTFFIRRHTGLTHRLAQYHAEWLSLPCPNSSGPSPSLTAFMDGPYGTPPIWEEYGNLVLIATSTGVSFPLSVMHFLGQLCLQGNGRVQVEHIRFIWIVRHLDPQLDTAVTSMLQQYSVMLRESGVIPTVDFYATCPNSHIAEETVDVDDQFVHLRQARGRFFAGRPPLRILNPDDVYRRYEEGIDSDTETSSTCASAVSSTLIDADEDRSFPEAEPPDVQAERRELVGIPSFPVRTLQLPRSETCDCQHIQSSRSQSNLGPATDFIRRICGDRPDVSGLVASSAPSTDRRKTMVAICANRDLTIQAANAVAKMNLDFSLGKRARGADVFTEGFT